MSPTDAPPESALTDHEYDGIQEYDNPLPGWWVWLFWATIVFSVPYTFYYHFGEGPSIEESYQAELADYAQQLLAKYGRLEPDAATILKYADDRVAMAGMGSVFRAKCAQCHRTDGTGDVGPNLTDDHWINVKKVEDIFSVVQNGVTLKGMPSWEKQFSRTQLVLLAAYVASLRRHPHPGKAPQGDVIPPFETVH